MIVILVGFQSTLSDGSSSAKAAAVTSASTMYTPSAIDTTLAAGMYLRISCYIIILYLIATVAS